ESLNFAARQHQILYRLMSLSWHVKGSEEAAYAALCRSKAGLTRVLERRQQLLLGLRDPESRKIAEELATLRRQISQQALAHLADAAAQRQRMQQLSRRKEHLERTLAQKLPEWDVLPSGSQNLDLAKVLPPRTVFVDFLRYRRSAHDPKVPGPTRNNHQS